MNSLLDGNVEMAPWVLVLSIHALHPGAAFALSKIPSRSICVYILIDYCDERSFYERLCCVDRHIGFTERDRKSVV